MRMYVCTCVCLEQLLTVLAQPDELLDALIP